MPFSMSFITPRLPSVKLRLNMARFAALFAALDSASFGMAPA